MGTRLVPTGTHIAPASGRTVLARVGRAILRHLAVSRFREFTDGQESGRALVAYLVAPLLLPARLRDRVKFSNRGIAQEMARGLNELGYVVDVINFDNASWVPRERYDLFIGHAGTNFTELAAQVPRDAVRIYFATGMYWQEANKRLAARLARLRLAHGVALPPNRAASPKEETANKIADGIICLGNSAVAETYSAFARVFTLDNGVFPVQGDGWERKDFESGKKHFLFFAGGGNVLKGLDLLLEAFRGTELHLHVCQRIEAEFWERFARRFAREPNIHFYGHVRMRSRVFLKLAARCNWVIAASCTEGQPGAVLECMAHGLIPLVSDTANMDMDPKWSDAIEKCEVDGIRESAIRVTRKSVDECRRMAQEVVEVTRTRYTPQAFREGFKRAVVNIVAACGGTGGGARFPW